MVEVKRREGESNDSMFRRFSRKMQQSGILVRARKNRFHEPPKSKIILRRRALRREETRELREEQRKAGKLTYQSFAGRSRYGRDRN